jgi:hypothetical protein
MFKHHLEGAVQMVGFRGGPQTLGLNGLLEHFLSILLVKIVVEFGLCVSVPWDTCQSDLLLSE